MVATGITAQDLLRRDRWIAGAAAAAATVVAWAVVLRAHAAGTPARDAAILPHAHGSGPTAVAVGFALWMVMMVAMMLPAVMPWIVLFSSTSRTTSGIAPHGRTGLFVAGYLAAGAPYCAAAAVLQWLLGSRGLLLAADMRIAPAAGGVVLVAAGAFQLSRWKAACLAHCRNPLGFFLARWEGGPQGALRMGFRHGLFCLGCCWALMAAAFAVGLMNVLWMAILTGFLALEKVAPVGRIVGRAAGLGLIGWGLWLFGAGG